MSGLHITYTGSNFDELGNPTVRRRTSYCSPGLFDRRRRTDLSVAWTCCVMAAKFSVTKATCLMRGSGTLGFIFNPKSPWRIPRKGAIER